MKCKQATPLMAEVLNGAAPDEVRESLERHLDTCMSCWRSWNAARWSRSEETPLYNELRAFLGTEFEYGIDASWSLADEWNLEPRFTQQDANHFYSTAKNYAVSLTIFEASGQRPDYAASGLKFLRNVNARTVCDFGCGIGSDGIAFAMAGYQVTFVEPNVRSRSFVRSRLRKRELPTEDVHAELPCDRIFDAIWMMDVVEHILDITEVTDLLVPCISPGGIVCFDTHSSTKAGGRHPFHFPESIQRFREELAAKHMKPVTGEKPDSSLEVWCKC